MAKQLKITVEGKVYDVIVEDMTEDAGSTFYQSAPMAPSPSAAASAPVAPATPPPAAAAPVASAGAKDKVAPLGGLIVEVSVSVGAQVKAGDKVAVIEAMKMKTVVAADHDGKVTNIMVKVGDAVEGGQPLMTIE